MKSGIPKSPAPKQNNLIKHNINQQSKSDAQLVSQ